MRPMSEEDVLRRLDSIIGILNLAFADPIERARNKILADQVMAAILEELGTETYTAADILGKVVAATKQSERTVQQRIATLVSQRIVERIGSGSKISYHSTGLIGVAKRRPEQPRRDAVDG